MTLFDDREKAFEAQFRNEQDLAFKVMVRRDKLFGRWAATQVGLSGDDAKAFVSAVIDSDVASHEVLHKVQNDLAAVGRRFGVAELTAKLNEFHEVAREQVFKEQNV